MGMMFLLPFTPLAAPGTYLTRFLALNNEHAVELSHASPSQFSELVAAAKIAFGLADPVAFLLAYDETSPYCGANYLWFKSRYDRFVYVDRVVVEPRARGRGIAGAFYQELFRRARTSGHETICAEINIQPPNPGSDTFHARLGFREVGRSDPLSSGKIVRYVTAPCNRVPKERELRV